ncbi:MAG: histidine kinase [Tannerellaceae bacterium]|nr:histidine kinase [Tannerellaceae bacterium]
MTLLDRYTSLQLLVVSVIGAIFVIYPNIACLPWELSFMDPSEHPSFLIFFAFRYIFFVGLIWGLIKFNQEKISTSDFRKRMLVTLLWTGVAYLFYAGISLLSGTKHDCFGSILLFQFFITFIVCTFVGHVSQMYAVQRTKELEIEQLKVETLQSRCDALANQINPHFFFNSLNGLTGLVRKKDEEKTIEYVTKLSDIFRYILQSDKKGLVSLEEELKFVEAFRYTMEVRFANKLVFDIEVEENKRGLKLPVLSLLPLIDNIVVHNTIDSEHIMKVSICVNEQNELMISNPLYPKLVPPATNGTGLKNVENRLVLLTGKSIRTESDGGIYYVYLPLS